MLKIQVKRVLKQDVWLAELPHIEITHGNVDICKPVVLSSNRCRRRVDSGSGRCVNSDCPVGSGDAAAMRADPAEQDSSFSLQLALSDHTGTLQNCSIQGEAAAKMLNCSVSSL